MSHLRFHNSDHVWQATNHPATVWRGNTDMCETHKEKYFDDIN